MGVTVTMAAGAKSRSTKTLIENEGQMDSARKHDHLVGLYNLGANYAERKNKDSNDYWDERNADECSFQPKINKPRIKSGDRIPSNPSILKAQPNSVKNIKGMDKLLERLEKGRQDAAYRKKMTERSNATALTVNKAKKAPTEKHYHNKPAAKNGTFNYGMDRSKYKSGFEIDGA